MEENNIVKFEGWIINRISNQIAVTNKLLTLSDPQLIPYRKGDKWGFCTADKKIVIDCIYNSVKPFSKHIAIVEKDGKYHYINSHGNIVSDITETITQ